MTERENVVHTLVSIGVGKGIIPFDQDKVLAIFTELADLERGKPSHLRIGFSYAADNLESKGITQILNQAQSIWPEVPPEPIPLQRVPPGVHLYECIISVKLNQYYAVEDIKRIFHDYLVQATPMFDGNVVNAAHLYDAWYDLHVRYSTGLEKIYELILKVDWVLDAVTKPCKFFGVRTVHTFAR